MTNPVVERVAEELIHDIDKLPKVRDVLIRNALSKAYFAGCDDAREALVAALSDKG